MSHTIVVQGAEDSESVPGIEKLPKGIRVRYAVNAEQLRESLPGAEMMLGWNFQSAATQQAWSAGDSLRWIHWCGAGVDSLLFEELVESDVVLTNSRGIFDRSMAEYTLGLIIAFAKRFPETLRHQGERKWEHRYTEQLLGKSVLVVGAGSIGREIGQVLDRFGLDVDGVGRRARDSDPDFRRVYAVAELDEILPEYDYVVVIAPSTSETYRLFGAAQFACMKESARFINLARGAVVDESALISALDSGEIAEAALDVFETEPLDSDSPLWNMPNVIVSPHMSGDYYEYHKAVMEIFLDNVNRFIDGKPLTNVVDKVAGFVPSA